MSIDTELTRTINNYELLIRKRSGHDNLKAADKNKISVFSKMLSERRHIKGIEEIRSQIMETPELGLTTSQITELTAIKERINRLANTRITLAQKSSVAEKNVEEDTESNSTQNTIEDEEELKQAIQMSLERPESIAVETPGVLKQKVTEKLKPKPTNRLDAVFQELPFGGLSDVKKIVLQYDQDSCNEILRDLQQGKTISNFVRSVAESVTVLDLNLYPGIKSIAEIFKLFKNLEILIMPIRGVGDVKALSELKKLQELCLSYCSGITDAYLFGFIGSKKLLKLDLARCRSITDAGLDQLTKKFPALQSLNLTGCDKITDTGLDSLAKLTDLQFLDLTECNKITDTGLGSLAKLTDLQFLDLTRCNKITDTGLGLLATLTSLQSLELRGCNQITDTGLGSLATFRVLKSLKLGFNETITDTSLASLARITSLESLKLAACNNVTGVGFGSLTTLTALRSLDLEHSGITDSGLASLSGFTALQSLNLKGCDKITNTGLGSLTTLTALQSLNLEWCTKISDAGLSLLVTLTDLQSLELTKCGITDAVFSLLAKFKFLQHLGLRDCYKIQQFPLRKYQCSKPDVYLFLKKHIC